MQSSVLATKGKIVIPKGLRDKYKPSPGTKVFFEETTAGIILKQVDAAFIQNAKGMIPAKKSKSLWLSGGLRTKQQKE